MAFWLLVAVFARAVLAVPGESSMHEKKAERVLKEVNLVDSWKGLGKGCCKQESKGSKMIYNYLAPDLNSCKSVCIKHEDTCQYISYGSNWNKSTWCQVMPYTWTCDTVDINWCRDPENNVQTYYYQITVAESVPAPAQIPTTAPTLAPTAAPVPLPTPAPTQAPTLAPMPPTPAPTPLLTQAPTPAPFYAPPPPPTPAPTPAPTLAPTTPAPTQAPTPAPFYAPPPPQTPAPTLAPTTPAPTQAPPQAPVTPPAPIAAASPCGTTTPSLSALAYAPPVSYYGRCSGQTSGWGKNGDCLSNDFAGNFQPGTFTFHCPWESMMLMSAKNFGGCSHVKIDCISTSYRDILQLYADHEASGPPEGDLRTLHYASCCIRHNCEGGPDCGEAPWDPTKDRSKQLPPGVSPCGPVGCSRLYDEGSAVAWVASQRVPIAACFSVVVGMLCAVLVMRRLRRQAYLEYAASALSDDGHGDYAHPSHLVRTIMAGEQIDEEALSI